MHIEQKTLEGQHYQNGVQQLLRKNFSGRLVLGTRKVYIERILCNTERIHRTILNA